MVVSNRNLLFQGSICRGYASFREGNYFRIVDTSNQQGTSRICSSLMVGSFLAAPCGNSRWEVWGCLVAGNVHANYSFFMYLAWCSWSPSKLLGLLFFQIHVHVLQLILVPSNCFISKWTCILVITLWTHHFTVWSLPYNSHTPLQPQKNTSSRFVMAALIRLDRVHAAGFYESKRNKNHQYELYSK